MLRKNPLYSIEYCVVRGTATTTDSLTEDKSTLLVFFAFFAVGSGWPPCSLLSLTCSTCYVLRAVLLYFSPPPLKEKG